MIHAILIWLSLFSPIHKEKITEEFSVSVYPNPSKGLFQVEVRGATKEMNLRLYNMTGQLISEHKLNNIPSATTYSLGSEQMHEGIYNLIVMCNDGQQMVKRILIIND